MEHAGKITDFTQLITWQVSHQLVLGVYRATKTFPKEEAYALTSQLRRAAVSITSNIAEGFGRRNPKEKTQFYYLAKGSLTEVKNQLIIARDVGYISPATYSKLDEQFSIASKLLHGLINSTKPTS